MKDIIIIGAGPGGADLALHATAVGLSVLLFEESLLGGTCLNEGCIPTKSLLASSSKQVKESMQESLILAQEKKETVVTSLRKGLEYSLQLKNVEVIHAKASFVDDHTVTANGISYFAKHIVIASGSSVVIPPILGLTNRNSYTSKSILELREIPQHLVVIGGGIIGLEMASIFLDYGAKVTVVEAESRILSFMDKELTKRLQMDLTKRGVTFYVNTRVVQIDEDGRNHIVSMTQQSQEHKISCSHILVAAGRKANIQSLDLHNTSIKVIDGAIETNEDFQTNVPHIYAIGDCNQKWMLAHAASASAKHVLQKILNKPSYTRFDLMPNCLYTHLQFASVGIQEAELLEQEAKYRTHKYPFRANAMAMCTDETEGLMKLIIQEERLVGVAILHPQASTLIAQASLYIQLDKTLEELSQIIVAHPSITEALAEAIQQAKL